MAYYYPHNTKMKNYFFSLLLTNQHVKNVAKLAAIIFTEF